MEARRFRLLILAYLRDPNLVKPDYPNGIRSVLRETALLQAVAADLDSNDAVERLKIESAFMCHIRPDAAKSMMEQFNESLLRFAELREMNLKGNIRRHNGPAVKGNVQSIVKLYEKLEKAGILHDNSNQPSDDS